MDNLRRSKPVARRKNPSFSSSLLDQIYRSIDDQAPTKAAAAEAEADHQKTGTKTEKDVDLMLYEQTVGRRKSASAEYYGDLSTNYFPQSFGLNSCSTSSDSSVWTSSESETCNSLKSKLAVRTTSSCQQQHKDDKMHASERKLKNECGGFVKAKSKALKMYGDLKKSKATQPISPGTRLASFLNSLFTSTGNTKKVKSHETKYISANSASACSSASSFSRSCLSKTPSSRGKLSDGAKRSVRFYPMISLIMDEVEDRIYKDNGRSNKGNIPARNSICGEEVIEKNRRARELLRNYEKRLEECKMMNDDEDEDCESCTSSDLFELDNLDSVSQRYCEELPVYETTSLDANRAIAHGLIV
ncbi:protein BIG GRAIN 1-like A [Apium graveolens]|uniref:protein BIG GRAIN 1-like A n=1 Tax=Apium graveolens TaxID=4045 RepID=UPI003D7B5272